MIILFLQWRALLVILSTQSSVDILLPSSLLLPYWKEMINGLSSVGILAIKRVQLSQDVTTMLLKSLKTTPLLTLMLSKNNLGNHGFEFVADVLDTSLHSHACILNQIVLNQKMLQPLLQMLSSSIQASKHFFSTNVA